MHNNLFDLCIIYCMKCLMSDGAGDRRDQCQWAQVPDFAGVVFRDTSHLEEISSNRHKF